MPSEPISVAVTDYSGSSLSLSYAYPHVDGGEIITEYKVEIDFSATFNYASADYREEKLSIVWEQQDIIISFDSDDNYATAGGTFTIQYGGRVSANLNHDITPLKMAMAIRDVVGVTSVGQNPIEVTRSYVGRGLRLRVTFTRMLGNIGKLIVDGSSLVGNNPQVKVREVVAGNADVIPGSFTYETQSVSTKALSDISGDFTLGFENSYTPAISFDASASEMKTYLEDLPTIHAVNVDVIVGAAFNERTWVITFTHLSQEKMQGAGNVHLLIANADNLAGNSAEVIVQELVAGTNPFIYTVEGLTTGVEYFVRVSAKNSRGYGPVSSLVRGIPKIHPGKPQTVSLGVHSKTSLLTSWSPPDTNGGDPITAYKVEWFTEFPSIEQQTLASSAENGISEVQSIRSAAKTEGMGGFFRLTFRSETTENIVWNAPADGENSVKSALTKLSTIGAVGVTRSLSYVQVQGLTAKTDGANVVDLSSHVTHTKIIVSKLMIKYGLQARLLLLPTVMLVRLHLMLLLLEWMLLGLMSSNGHMVMNGW